jgi:hypothetical protein
MVTDFLSLDAKGLRRDFIFDRSNSAFTLFTSAMPGFLVRGLARRDDPDDISAFSLAVAHRKAPGV